MAESVKCFKCGQTGHWSRDCTNPPSEWLSRPKAPAAAAGASASRSAFTPDRAEPADPSSSQRAPTHTPTAASTQARGQGCYKCGKTGHWARDCSAPPSQQIPRTFDAMENQPPPNAEPPKSQGPKKAVSKRKRKIKIRFAELKERDALSDVFCNFPARFAKQFKGKGHEVSDLRRLLEMYRIWQQKHFPLHGFDEALDQIADIGKTNQLKMEMREIRQDVLKVMEDSRKEGELPQGTLEDLVLGDAVNPAAADAPTEAPAAAPGGSTADWDEDDELLALQQEAWEQEADAVPMDMLNGPPARRQAGSTEAGPSEPHGELAHGFTASQLADDEELLALAMEDAQPSECLTAAASAPAERSQRQMLSSQPTPSQLVEDEELLALAMEDAEPAGQHEQPGQPSIQGTAAEQDPSAFQLCDDEERLALALEDAVPAGQPGQPVASHAAPAGLQQLSVSQMADDEELLALAMEDDAPGAPPQQQAPEQLHQRAGQPVQAFASKTFSRLSRLQRASSSQQQPRSPDRAMQQQSTALADDEDTELTLLHVDEEPLQQQQQQQQQQRAPKQAAAAMPNSALLEDKTDAELLDLIDADGEPSQQQQAPKRPATAVLDSDDEEETLVFARKKQAVLAKDSPVAAAPQQQCSSSRNTAQQAERNPPLDTDSTTQRSRQSAGELAAADGAIAAAAPGAADDDEELLALTAGVCMPDAAPAKTAKAPQFAAAGTELHSCTKSLADISAEDEELLALAAEVCMPDAAAAKVSEVAGQPEGAALF